jgi:S-adenosylmethionine hydrolase
MLKPATTITFTSDFGTADGYAGAVKGVILSIYPGARIVDISHDIRPGDVESAAWCLLTSTGHYPKGTVHLAVVDPSVGSGRLPVILQGESGRIFVGPDNGIFYLALGGKLPLAAWSIDPEKAARGAVISKTFHGRDIFGPAAALVAKGVAIKKIARAMDPKDVRRLNFDAGYQLDDTTVRGRVIHIDRFGNLITSIPDKYAVVMAEGEVERIPVQKPVSCYNDIKGGQINFVQGSGGFLEIAAKEMSAAETTGAHKGSLVVAHLKRRH